MARESLILWGGGGGSCLIEDSQLQKSSPVLVHFPASNFLSLGCPKIRKRVFFALNKLYQIWILFAFDAKQTNTLTITVLLISTRVILLFHILLLLIELCIISRNLFFLINLPLIHGVFLCLTLVSLFSAKLFSSEGLRRKKLVYSGKKVRRTFTFFTCIYVNVKASANHCVSVNVLVNPCVTFSNPLGGFVSTVNKKGWAHQLVHSYGDSSEGLRLDVHFRMDCHTRICLLKYSWTGALGHSEGSIAQLKSLSYSIF
jgi:hypothetical protein